MKTATLEDMSLLSDIKQINNRMGVDIRKPIEALNKGFWGRTGYGLSAKEQSKFFDPNDDVIVCISRDSIIAIEQKDYDESDVYHYFDINKYGSEWALEQNELI